MDVPSPSCWARKQETERCVFRLTLTSPHEDFACRPCSRSLANTRWQKVVSQLHTFQMMTLFGKSLFLVKARKRNFSVLNCCYHFVSCQHKNKPCWWDKMFSLNVTVSFEMQWCRKHKGVEGKAHGKKVLSEAELPTKQLLKLVQVISS